MFESTRVLIFGKTYPELSTKHTETVCTGGFREDGRPIRLYPVHLRYLEGPQQYKLYQWITVPIEKSTKDTRPESYRVDPARIECGEVVEPDGGPWRRRRETVFRDPSWHFGGMDELHEANRATRRSIGMVKPGVVDAVRLIPKAKGEREVFERKSRDLQMKKESDMFDAEYKQLAFLPNEIRLDWRCTERCATCSRQPHGMNVLDWGLLELARRQGWQKAVAQMESIADLTRKDFRLFLGTFKQHQQAFGIIGLWYPAISDQPEFL